MKLTNSNILSRSYLKNSEWLEIFGKMWTKAHQSITIYTSLYFFTVYDLSHCFDAHELPGSSAGAGTTHKDSYFKFVIGSVVEYFKKGGGWQGTGSVPFTPLLECCRTIFSLESRSIQTGLGLMVDSGGQRILEISLICLGPVSCFISLFVSCILSLADVIGIKKTLGDPPHEVRVEKLVCLK